MKRIVIDILVYVEDSDIFIASYSFVGNPFIFNKIL